MQSGAPLVRVYAAVAALVGWCGLALRLVLAVAAGGDVSAFGRIVNVLSSFMVLADILVALVLTAVALDAAHGWLAGLRRPGVQAAAALYMAFAGLIYFLLLRTLWAAAGWSLAADVILHYAMPLLYLIYWLAFAPKGRLRPTVIPGFLAFPFLYAVYTYVRGPLVHWYPYPFLDPGSSGLGLVAINVIFLIMGFSLAAAALIVVDRMMAPAEEPGSGQ